MNHCFIDIETRSFADLDLGTNYYASHDSTQIISIAWDVADRMHVWIGIDLPFYDELIKQFPEVVFVTDLVAAMPKKDHIFIGHNANYFDRIVLEKKLGLYRSWVDTIDLARSQSLPASLANLSEYYGRKKLSQEEMKLLSTPKKGKFIIGTMELWKKFIAYNIADVENTKLNYYELIKEGNCDRITADQNAEINSRGIPINIDRVRLLYSHYLRYIDLAEKRLRKRVDINPNSRDQVLAWIRSKGIRLDSLAKSEIDDFLINPLDYCDTVPTEVIDYLHDRRSIVARANRKLITAINNIDDDRLRHQLVYHKAITGRYAGREFQIHNLPRAVDDLDYDELLSTLSNSDEFDRVVSHEMAKAKTNIMAIMNSLLRTVVESKYDELYVSDFTQIEARCVAWLAKDIVMIKEFETKDIYQVMADKIGASRFIGKQLILGCGYSMSGAKFKLMCKSFGKDLDAMGIDADACVKAYRESYPLIPKLWKTYDFVCKKVIETGNTIATNRVVFSYKDGTLIITLPSGRKLFYRKARIEQRVPAYAKMFNFRIEPKDTIVFFDPRGFDKVLYGGLITENISQAISRDILVDKIVHLLESRLQVIFHVHDEIVSESGVNRFDEFKDIMNQRRGWYIDFPIDTKSHKSKYWRKF